MWNRHIYIACLVLFQSPIYLFLYILVPFMIQTNSEFFFLRLWSMLNDTKRLVSSSNSIIKILTNALWVDIWLFLQAILWLKVCYVWLLKSSLWLRFFYNDLFHLDLQAYLHKIVSVVFLISFLRFLCTHMYVCVCFLDWPVRILFIFTHLFKKNFKAYL